MGEFFFRNQIDFTTERFVKITSMSNTSRYEVYRGELTGRTLLTIGGGRDSALAAALLRDSGHPFTCMMLNPSTAAQTIARHVSALPPLIIRRPLFQPRTAVIRTTNR